MKTWNYFCDTYYCILSVRYDELTDILSYYHEVILENQQKSIPGLFFDLKIIAVTIITKFC